MKKYLPYAAALVLCSSVFLSPLSTNAVTKQNNPSNSLPTKKDNNHKNFDKKKLVIKTTSPLTKNQLNKINATVKTQITELKYTVIQFKTEKALKTGFQTLKTYKNVQNINLSPTYKMMDTGNPREAKQYMHKLVHSKEAQKFIGKSTVKVAVIDTGIDHNHPDLKGKVISSENSANKLHSSVFQDHATHVSGIIAANKDNNLGGFGINPRAEILGYDVFDGSYNASDYIISEAILKATKDGAQVINMSLGSSEPSEVLNSAVQAAHAKGVTIVAAAGNDGNDIKNYPASYENVISVGSVNNNSVLSSFSSYGLSMNIVAPGEDIYSTTYSAKGSSYESLSGTSMASPVVAGVASLILAKNPKLSPEQVQYILQNTAQDLGANGFDNKYASGLVDALAAVKYDRKKIPNLTTKKWTDELIKKDATDFKLGETAEHSFKVSNEQQWYKLPVVKGQKIQIKASGDERTDLKLFANFYTNENNEKTEINDDEDGFEEAYYMEATHDGTLAIGLQDVNGLTSLTPIKLSITTGEFPKDESGRNNIIELDSLNKVISDQYMQPQENDAPDEDVFHFKATKSEVVQMKLSNIPGVKSNVSVYTKQQFYSMDNQNSEDEDEQLTSFNSQSKSKETVGSFEAKVNQDYYIVISNEHGIENEINFEDFSFGPASEVPSYEMVKPKVSLIPYSLTLQSKAFPEDEDQVTLESLTKIIDGKIEHIVSYFKENARSFNLDETNTGYLNGSADVDGFYINTKESGIYQMNIEGSGSASLPNISLYEMNEETAENAFHNKEVDNNAYNDSNDKSIWSLKANTTYLVVVQLNEFGLIPFDGYKITPTLLIKNSEDAYEPNNSLETAKTIPYSGKLEANIASYNDVDHYYYSASTTGLISLKYQLKILTEKDKQLIPEVLRTLYVPYIEVTLDANNNKKLEENEKNQSIIIEDFNDLYGLETTLEVKKGENYFITITPYLYESSAFSAIPYELILKAVPSKDEDANNKVKKNVPNKTISMKKNGTNHFERTAYLNPGQMNGDQDWYTYKATKDGHATIKLAVPDEIDGVVEIYKNGKRIKKVDSYDKGEVEEISLAVSKGQYYFKVTDYSKRASANPYKFSIKVQ